MSLLKKNRYHLNSSGDSSTPTSSVSSNESKENHVNINNYFNQNYLKNNRNNQESIYQKRAKLAAQQQQYLWLQEKAQLERQLREMSPQQYLQYKQNQLQEQQKLAAFQQQLMLRQQHECSVHKHKSTFQGPQNEHLQQQIMQQTWNKLNNSFTINNYNNSKGLKSHLGGMTTEQTIESPSIHNSSLKQQLKKQLPPSSLPTFISNHNTSPTKQQQYHKSSLQSPNKQYKKPLTSPNNAIPSTKNLNCYNGLPLYANTYYFDSNSFKKPNDCNDDDDELTDDTLKRNVQIVLNNLDRYALRSIILNDQIENLTFSLNNNNNINDIMASSEHQPQQQLPDYNSNPFSYGGLGGQGHLNCSIASSTHDFTHDNSDYQWFLDYGYRDGVQQHQSVLSSLSASYNGIGELSYYDDLAKNIDANLAEVDMESFRAEDIHSFLTHLPSYCCSKKNSNDIDNSICKSELLFSPVKETPQQLISTDSLDLDAYPDEGDIILTCKANKDNYTIAFEGSTLYSDESFYAEPNDINIRNRYNFINLHSNLDDIVKRKSLEVSMCRSDNAFTTWSKLKKSNTMQLQRYPSGNNNNTSMNMLTQNHSPNCFVRKSFSLPNLIMKKEKTCRRQLNVSQALTTSTVESSKVKNLLPMCQMPISQIGSIDNPDVESMDDKMHTTESSESQQQHQQDHPTKQQEHHNLQQQSSTLNQPPAFNLVKLFIKQKSCSSSADTCMDVSSECWPSSDASSSSTERYRRKNNCIEKVDNNKQPTEEIHNDCTDLVNDNTPADSSYQLDSLDVCDESQCTTKDSLNTTPTKKPTTVTTALKQDLYREVFELSPKRNQLRNPLIYNLQINNNNNNNNSISDNTSDNLTQIYNCNNNSKLKLMTQPSVMTRSIQTSILLKDRLRFVPPSFLASLNKLSAHPTNRTIEKQAPVYVIYPNYALPDLGFIQQNPTSEIVLSPFNYKTALASAAIRRRRRPTSLNTSDEEALKHIEKETISDWKSLVTLLPIEYRRRLKNIPEADPELEPECSMKPLFCMSPPLKRNIASSLCDCAALIQHQQQQTCDSSSGSSSQQPSSGYRGSSTLLTDSCEFDPPTLTPSNDPLRNMFIYQYDNVIGGNNELYQEKLPPSGRRGILRRSNNSRSKRNSMFEENTHVRNPEKRRSLQETQFYDENLEIFWEHDDSRQFYDITGRKSRRDQDAQDARTRAENFLSNVPKSELKYYAEIASILESVDDTNSIQYDVNKLKNEVSRALSQKKVSFNQNNGGNYLHTGNDKKFSTPPNSPAISMAGLRVNSIAPPNNSTQLKKELSQAEKDHLNKISSNRFKRLQIQWELLSKDSSIMLKDLASEKETKSGGSTPTSAQKSRIPRPVSYPASKAAAINNVKSLRSPSRIVPPKYGGVSVTTAATSPSIIPNRARTPNNRNASNINGTPKKRVQSPRATARTR